jgi:hypothetical protein
LLLCLEETTRMQLVYSFAALSGLYDGRRPRAEMETAAM